MSRDASGENAARALDERWSGLMAAAQRGERVAYATLLRECVPLVRRVAARQGVRPDQIDDVVQDVLIAVHRSRATYDPARSFAAWLRAIAQRRAIDMLRKSTRTDRREIHSPTAYESYADGAADPAARSEAQSGAALVAAAAAELPARQREALEHLAFRDLSLDAAAAATGRSKGALKVNFHRALKSLRARLGGED
jgi:RNA polymerase sigma-70 factor (ECF subfamily)